MRRKNAYMVLAVAALLGTASPALAQVCTGFAMAPASTQAMFGMEFPDGANSFGISVARKMDDQLLVGAGYAVTTSDDVAGIEIPDMHSFTVLGSYDIPLNAGSQGPIVAACPNVRLGYSKMDDMSMFATPIGVSFGTALEVGNGVLVAPWVNPFFLWARSSVGEFSDSETDFGWAVGTNVVYSSFLIGADFGKVGNGDGVFGLRFALLF